MDTFQRLLLCIGKNRTQPSCYSLRCQKSTDLLEAFRISSIYIYAYCAMHVNFNKPRYNAKALDFQYFFLHFWQVCSNFKDLSLHNPNVFFSKFPILIYQTVF